MQVISQLKFNPFFSGSCKLLLPLVSICSKTVFLMVSQRPSVWHRTVNHVGVWSQAWGDLGQPSENQNSRLTVHSSFSLLSGGRSLGCGSFLQIRLCCAGSGMGHSVQMQGTFLLASIQFFLALHSPGVLRPLIWFLEFSQRQFGPYVVVKSVFLQGNVSLKLLTPLSCWYPSLFWNINLYWN